MILPGDHGERPRLLLFCEKTHSLVIFLCELYDLDGVLLHLTVSDSQRKCPPSTQPDTDSPSPGSCLPWTSPHCSRRTSRRPAPAGLARCHWGEWTVQTYSAKSGSSILPEASCPGLLFCLRLR